MLKCPQAQLLTFAFSPLRDLSSSRLSSRNHQGATRPHSQNRKSAAPANFFLAIGPRLLLHSTSRTYTCPATVADSASLAACSIRSPYPAITSRQSRQYIPPAGRDLGAAANPWRLSQFSPQRRRDSPPSQPSPAVGSLGRRKYPLTQKHPRPPCAARRRLSAFALVVCTTTPKPPHLFFSRRGSKKSKKCQQQDRLPRTLPLGWANPWTFGPNNRCQKTSLRFFPRPRGAARQIA
jgi:hypothetical protein